MSERYEELNLKCDKMRVEVVLLMFVIVIDVVVDDCMMFVDRISEI